MAPLIVPKEVIENIIDQAEDDTESLRNFALTCRDLLPRSRFHLLRFILLQDEAQLHAFYVFLDAYPNLRPLVHSMTMSATRDGPKSLLLLQIVPIPILTKLPNLFEWQITDPYADERQPCRYLSFSPATLESLGELGESITDLNIDSISLLTCTDFARYLFAFRGLRNARCRSVSFKTQDNNEVLHEVKRRLVEQCQLLGLVIDREVPDIAAQLLLEISQPTLEELALVVQKDTKLELPTLVGQLSGLRLLQLGLQLFDPSDKLLGTVIRHAFEIFMTLGSHSQTLTHLVIHLEDVRLPLLANILTTTPSDIVWQLCQELETVLLGLSQLEGFEICHDDSDAPRTVDWTPVLEQYFPTLQRRGVLTFSYSTPSHRQQAAHERRTTTLAISPDGKWLASGSEDSTIILWDAHSWTITYEWVAHLRGVTTLSFSPDSQLLASGGRDEQAVIWDVRDGVRRVTTIDHHTDGTFSCAWSPDGTIFISGSNDGIVRVWEAAPPNNLIRPLLDSGPAYESGHFALFSPDSRWIASAGDNHSCNVWDAKTGALHRVLRGHERMLTSAAFDPASRRIATASYDHTVRIWDVETGGELLVLEGHTNWVRDVAFSPDGTRVLSASDDRTAKIWDAIRGDVVLTFEGHSKRVWAACFSPDGKYAVSASWDTTVQLWNVSDGSCIKTFTEHTDRVRHVVFSPDGGSLISGGWDGLVCVRRVCDVLLQERLEEKD